MSVRVVAKVGKRIKRRETLKPPGIAAWPIGHERLRERAEVTPRRAAIGVGPRELQTLDQELDGPRSITLVGADESTALALATVQLASDDHAVVLFIEKVTDGRGLEHVPVCWVDRDCGLAKFVDFIDSPEANQASRCLA